MTSKSWTTIITAIIVTSMIAQTHQDSAIHAISKRFVLFPRYSVVQITGGLSVPAIFPRRSINLSLGFQMNHDLPWNFSNFEPLYGRRDDNHPDTDVDFDRSTMYEYVARVVEAFGFDGEECLLRTICEAAEIPMHTEEQPIDNDGDNLLEQILHFLLSPSKDLGHAISYSNTTLEHKALVAEQLGRVHGACADIFPCPISLLDLFTSKYF